MSNKIKYHNFNSKRYKISNFYKYGECDDPNFPNKEMKIPVSSKSKEDLEIIIHESLHACFWEKSEEEINKKAKDITDLLWRLGWRKRI